VHKLNFVLDINKHVTNDDQWKRTSSSDRKPVWENQYVFLRPSSRASRESPYAVQVNRIFLSEKRYFPEHCAFQWKRNDVQVQCSDNIYHDWFYYYLIKRICFSFGDSLLFLSFCTLQFCSRLFSSVPFSFLLLFQAFTNQAQSRPAK